MIEPHNFEHLYIHWPFCKSRCFYCDFIALAEHEKFFEHYHQALCKEIELVAQNLPQRQKIKTVFLGGGTPSLYPIEMLEDLFRILNKCFEWNSYNPEIPAVAPEGLWRTGLKQVQDDKLEITIETNPADITREKLQVWKSLGINRLSMGVQVLDNTILKKLNRQQTTSDVFRAIELAPQFFENISIDLILGLPDINQDVWLKTLQTVVQWPIKHISVYFLTVYEKTPLYFKVEKGDLKLSDDSQLVDLYEMTVKILDQNKFFQYEISNFSKPGYESIHNRAYWDRKPYYGFGLGAASFDGQKRFINHNNIETYIRSIIDDQKAPISSAESLNTQQIVLETLMLSLRQKNGVDLHSVLYLLLGTQKTKFYENVELLKKELLLQQTDNQICLSQKGMILENEVILKLCDGLF